jgi:hypothetical protein
MEPAWNTVTRTMYLYGFSAFTSLKLKNQYESSNI